MERKPRGFALLSPEQRREMARRGGSSVPNERRGFSLSATLAVEAGKKGGKISRGGGRPRGSTKKRALAEAGTPQS